jgi:hypothetical protein
MAISKRIIHCLVDREPTAFHASDADGTKASYAVNLSFEVHSDGATADAAQDVQDAKDAFKIFLQAVREVRFQLYKVTKPDPADIELGYVAEITGRISEPDAPANPDAIYDWLVQEQKLTGDDVAYWTTPDNAQWLPDTAVDVNIAGASHRLRAAQSWNAPAAHKFMLTHVAQLPTDALTGDGVVVLPFFVDDPAQPTLHGKALDDGPLADEVACSFDYDAKADFGAVACYTSIVSKASPLDLKSVYPGLTPEGYFEVDPEAPAVHRLLSWFELRAASLLSSNLVLATRAANKEESKFEKRFGVSTVKVTKAGQTVDVTCCSIVWYVVARLLSALDNVVVGVLKPVLTPPGMPNPTPRFMLDRHGQGEVLAPLVSAVLSKIQDNQKDRLPKDQLPPAILDPDKITSAIRTAVARVCPLVETQSGPKRTRSDVVRALRQVYGIEPPKDGDPKDADKLAAREFVALALACYEEPRNKPAIDKPNRLRVMAYADARKSAADHKSDLVRTVSKALLDYEQPLVDEAGAEAAIIKFIEMCGPSLAAEVANAYLNDVKLMKPLPSGLPDDATITAAVKAAFEQAWAAYRTLLAGTFNGAEAVRRSASGSFVRGLLDYTKLEPKSGNPALLEQNLSGSAFFSKRFTTDAAATDGCFDAHAAALIAPDADMLLLTGEADAIPAPDLPGHIDAQLVSIRTQLIAGFADFVAPAKSVNDPNARFIPDSMPQPLAIEIAANIDGSKIDQFSRYFNGIGLAIERSDLTTQGDRWAHAHLADLTWTPPPPTPVGGEPQDATPDVQAALHPMLPAVNDGRGPMFIEYQGFPFADRALEARVVGNDAEPRDPRRPFYVQDPHEAADAFSRVPRLAYGRAFKTFSFVTSNAGTLPFDLQERDQGGNVLRPWMPHSTIQQPADASLIGSVDYQRRTAIAQVAIVEKSAGGRARIGASIDGVMPIATDYPRVVLQAEPYVKGVRDLLRDPDGHGAMVATKTSEWQISDINVSGKPSTLTLYFFEGIATDPSAEGIPFVIDKDFDKLSGITVRVIFVPDAPNLPKRQLEVWYDGVKVGTKDLPASDSFHGWLRLILKTGGDDPASMSFANIGSQKSDNVGQSLLILAPDNDEWKPGLSKPLTATISTPRVGYLDFDRWFANGDLFREAFGKDREDKTDNPGAVFMNGMAAAYAMRKFDAKLARELERLPDPAVEKIRLELSVLDHLTQTTPASVKAQLHDLEGRLSGVATKFAADAKGVKLRPPAWYLEHLFKPLDEAFRFDLTLKPGPLALEPMNRPRDMQRTASVPAGMVARLSMDTMVRAKLFEKSAKGHPSVFHRGLLQYASRHVFDSNSEALPPTHVIFPAAALLVETMYDGIEEFAAPIEDRDGTVAIKLAKAMISAQTIERARRFDLVAGEPKSADLRQKSRLLGEIDVVSQRWRPSGRPIYHLVNPREFALDDPDKKAMTSARTHPALPLALDEAGKLAQFELEAFFNRSDVDSQTVTQRLSPLPGTTTLQEHHWNPESATYFRHRFTLRSRYAGALLKRKKREVDAWLTDKPNHPLKTSAHGWTMRVAMLADLARIQLTRPQLRALIPLTTAPGGDGIDQPAPPVAAILQEPPFARGGLADRIATEIKTGFGYGFVKPEENRDERVEILDARKEAGHNPQLDYRALGSDTALSLTLRCEGPIGLTFDNVDAPAPAYPNSMLILKPDVLFGSKPPLEEFFAGVSMRRYIDPAWTGAKGIDKDGLEAESCWWIDFGAGDAVAGIMSPLVQYRVEGADELMPLLAFRPGEDHQIELCASKRAIDGYPGIETDWVIVAIVTEEQFGKLSALHQQVAAARHSLSLFVRTDSAKTERGEINTPLLIAGFEWSSPKEKAVKGDQGKAVEKPQPPLVTLKTTSARAFQTMASGPTFLRWTKTGRDFDFVHLAELANNEWRTGPVHVRGLAAKLDHETHEFLTFHRTGSSDSNAVWLCSSTFANPFPVHVHRHIGLITSRFLKELGSPAEIFCRTSADADARHQLVTPEGSLRLNDGKIFKPQEEVVRIVEFEVPAAILCATGPQVPPTYKQAYFDLVSTGFKFGEDKRGTGQLHFRFVGSPAHISKFSEIRLNFWLNRDSEPSPFRLPIKFANTAAKFAVGLRLALRSSGAANKSYYLQILYSDGTLVDTTGQFAEGQPFPLVNAENSKPGFFVSIDGAKGGSGEFWSDVSILHSPRALDKTGISPLEFGWLFSPSGDGEPTAHVSAVGLTNMVEAQARIVAVSPPIPIVSH